MAIRFLDEAPQTAPVAPAGTIRFLDEPAAQPAREGFLQRVGGELSERSGQLEAIKAADQGVIESGFQQAGVAAGALGDIVGEGLVSGARGLSAITPDIIEDPIREAAGDVGQAILDTPLGQAGIKALQTGMEEYGQFKEKNPRAARNIEALVNVGVIAAPVAGRAGRSGQTAIGDIGEAIGEAGVRQQAGVISTFADDLIRPKQTKGVREAEVARTTVTPRGTKVTALAPTEASASAEVAKLAIDPKKTLQGNYNIINDEIRKEALNLEGQLAKTKITFPRKEFDAQLKGAVDNLKDNPLLVGDAEKTAEKIVNKMKSITSANPSTPSGLLKSRKQLDNWVRSQKGTNIFDPTNENALSISLREIRNATNDFIDSKAVGTEVKESLRKQSNLFRALDNIAPKAADEKATAIGRLIQNVERAIPSFGVGGKALTAVTALGAGGLLAATSPFAVGASLSGLAAFKGAKALLSPKAKAGLSDLLKQTDKAIRATKDADLIRQLRADRLAVKELLTDEEE